ncbi:putative metabolite transport protein HI_1104 [Thrips palmi]|uniref:Metabolite transport protein HI_1104 n=1 Tax=Thrips palmi TaxID=161013 RepID=A0A6P8YCC8_THRPL|nr:putative metabolite transport protein HI_1104 [Thrips palmi]
MLFPKLEQFKWLYKWYVLVILTLGYLLAELGHFLIGVTSKATSRELGYGDFACQFINVTHYSVPNITICDTLKTQETCVEETHCEWDRNGLGYDYQLMAGPTFIAVYTIVGVFFGIAADRFNRVRMLCIATLIYAVSVLGSGAAKAYWMLILMRMVLAAGEAACNPLSTGLLSDIFPEKDRGLVMSIFNWGIFGGYGLAFPVGRYVTPMNLFNLGWRACYYMTGILAVVVAVLTGVTLREPERTMIGEEKHKDADDATMDRKLAVLDVEKNHPEKQVDSAWKVLLEPRVVLLCLAASVRHCGGICFAYNCDLYYNQYFPGVDLGWSLFIVTCLVGSIGVMLGGVISDRFVLYMGVRGRLLVLALSQLIATPFAFGSVYFDPLWAMITLGIAYLFAEMWFGILFATLVEVVPMSVRSTTVGVFLFVMNNIGGNLPVLVEPVSKSLGYREALYIFYVGFQFISSIMFFGTMFLMPKKHKKEEVPMQVQVPANGVVNSVSANVESIRL